MLVGRKTLFSAITILSIVGYGIFVFAAAPVGGYAPGETLDPLDCIPGDTDCKVKMFLATTLPGAIDVKYEQTDDFLGIGISGAGQVWDTGSGGYNVISNIDASSFGGSKNTTYLGYLSLGPGPESTVQAVYDDAQQMSQISLRALSGLGGQAQIQLTSKPSGDSIAFNFPSGVNYRFPTTSPSAGQSLVAQSATQLGWATASGSPSLTDTYVGFGSGTDTLTGSSDFIWLDSSKTFVVGDIGGSTNHTGFTVSDHSGPTGVISSMSDNIQFGTLNGGAHLWGDINTIAGTVQFGDVSGTGNNNYIKVDDSGNDVTISVSDVLGIRDDVGHLWFYLGDNLTSKTVILGDAGEYNNKNLFQINDFASQNFMQTDGTFAVQGSLGTQVFYTDQSPLKAVMGDVGSLGNGLQVFVDNSTRQAGLGDNLGVANGTIIRLQDDVQSIIANSLINDVFTNRFTVQNLSGNTYFKVLDNATAPMISLGDISNVNNQTKLIVDDANDAITASGKVFGTSGVGLNLDFANDIYELGQVSGGTGNHNKLSIDDGTSAVNVTTVQNFQVLSVPGNRVFAANTSTFTASLGDINSAGNDTLFIVDDTNRLMTATVNGIFKQVDPGGYRFINSDSLTGNFGLGDIDGAHNNTAFTIDDPNSTITARTKNIFQVADYGGNPFIYSNNAAGVRTYWLGDGNATHNSTGFKVQDNSGRAIVGDIFGSKARFSVNTTSDTLDFVGNTTKHYFTVDGVSKQFEFGDIDISQNGTKISIDDTNQAISFGFNGDDYTFPTGDGTADWVLATDGNGQLRWADAAVLASDASLKSNIQSIGYGLETLMQLNPVSYTMNSTGDEQIGFIAQEVEPLIPELIGTVSDGKKGLKYGQMTAVIVKSVQELNLKITDIENFASAENTTFLQNLIAWLGDTANGLTTLFAGQVNTHELCVDGQCLNQDDVRQLIDIKNRMGDGVSQGYGYGHGN